MVYRGRVKNGVVVFEGDAAPPEGAEVNIDVVEAGEVSGGSSGGGVDPDVLKLRETLMKFAGTVSDWPEDMARNHDHYLHGAPKK